VFAPLQTASKGGLYDAFVVKLTAAGTAFVYSTYLGGSSIDFGQSIAVGSGGIAYIAGYTSSTDFPAVSADQPANGGSFDVFVAKLNASGSALVESGFLGEATAIRDSASPSIPLAALTSRGRHFRPIFRCGPDSIQQ